MPLEAPIVLSARGLTKTYRERSLRDLLPGRARAGANGRPLRSALVDVDLDVPRGSSVGILGRNGAGKSTLLRILAGVGQPSSGHLVVKGSKRSLLDLGSGMIDELSGRQNALLQFGLDGLTVRESEQRWEGVLEFSGLGRFAEAPLKTYSSGMRIRLAYALAIAVPCDLLIADEVLAVGDEEFQRRCSHHVRDFLARGGSLVLASHNLYHVEKLCREAIWLDEGRVRARGPAREVTAAYRSWIDATDSVAFDRERGIESAPRGDEPRTAPMPMAKVGAPTPAIAVRTASDGLATTRLREGRGFTAVLSSAPPSGSLLEIVRPGGTCVLAIPVEAARIEIDELPLLPGRYRLNLVLADGGAGRLEGDVEIDCVGSSRELGVVRLRHAWRESIPA
ncbi:MAG: ABC transporter ATP-binding protein [Verrucomicrobia bacterium]|nr:ABC transporter ATP-binding protein [Verrucomicrobiota bacterium]